MTKREDSNPSLSSAFSKSALINDHCLHGKHLNIYSVTRLRVGSKKSYNCVHSSSVNPSCSTKYKNIKNLPQLISEKTSLCRFISLEMVDRGKAQNCFLRDTISCEGKVRVLPTKRAIRNRRGDEERILPMFVMNDMIQNNSITSSLIHAEKREEIMSCYPYTPNLFLDFFLFILMTSSLTRKKEEITSSSPLHPTA